MNRGHLYEQIRDTFKRTIDLYTVHEHELRNRKLLSVVRMMILQCQSFTGMS